MRGVVVRDGHSWRKALRVQGDGIQLLHWTSKELEGEGHPVAVRCPG